MFIIEATCNNKPYTWLASLPQIFAPGELISLPRRLMNSIIWTWRKRLLRSYIVSSRYRNFGLKSTTSTKCMIVRQVDENWNWQQISWVIALDSISFLILFREIMHSREQLHVSTVVNFRTGKWAVFFLIYLHLQIHIKRRSFIETRSWILLQDLHVSLR